VLERGCTNILRMDQLIFVQKATVISNFSDIYRKEIFSPVYRSYFLVHFLRSAERLPTRGVSQRHDQQRRVKLFDDFFSKIFLFVRNFGIDKGKMIIENVPIEN